MNEHNNIQNEVPSVFEAAERAAAAELKEYKKRIATMLFLIAGVDVGMALLAWLIYSDYQKISIELMRSMSGGVLICAMGVVAYRQPRAALWAGFAVYMISLGLAGYFYPGTVWEGVKAKGLIIGVFAMLLMKDI